MRDILNKQGRFDALWSRYHRWIWFWSIRYARNDVEIGHDFSQEVAIALFRNIDGLVARPGTLSEFLWVRRVATSTLGKHGHKARIEIATLTDELEQLLIEENSRAKETVQELMEYLPDEDKAFLQLYLDNYNYKEIAIIMETTESNVKTRLHRTRDKLKETYKKIYGDGQ